MKPLELTVYPIWENDLDGSCYTGTTIDDVRNVDFEVYRKRLTDAELAAEYWAAAEEATFRHFRAMYSDDAQRIEGILYRMARLPHYDEEPS